MGHSAGMSYRRFTLYYAARAVKEKRIVRAERSQQDSYNVIILRQGAGNVLVNGA